LGLPRAWIDHFRASAGRWVAPDEYFWTPQNFFTALPATLHPYIAEVRERTGGSFHSLPLPEQARVLGIEYSSMPITELGVGDRSPERASPKTGVEFDVLRHFERNGWSGEACEGSTFMLAKYLIHSAMAERGIQFPATDPLTHAPIVDRQLSGEERLELERASSRLTLSSLIGAYREYRSTRGVRTVHTMVSRRDREAGVRERPFLQMPQAANDLKEEQIEACWDALGYERIRDVCELWMRGYGGAGWPDLTMGNGQKLRLVEVKRKADKFTLPQTYWVRNIAKPMRWPVEVLHVTVG